MATQRQKKAIANVIAGDSVSKAMLKAGYSPNTAKNPKELTKTPVFLQTMERLGISDEKLAQRINEGLDATRAVVMGTKSEESFVDIQPDFMVRHKYVETSLKLKGYATEKPSNNVIVVPIYGGLSARPEDVSLPRYDSD